VKTNTKPGKSCKECGGKNVKTHLTTYPLKIDKKQINVGRVSVRECMDCHVLIPTKAGLEKLGRCMMTFMSILGE
jgi:hypothetical protein